MQIDVLPIESVIPYIRNPRDNSGAVDKVAASLKEFGFRQPIVVDEEMVVIAGHTRLLAAKKINLTEVPIHIATTLTKQQVKAYRLADNRVSQEAVWDNDLLALELDELKLDDYDLDLTGFDVDEIADLLADDPAEGLTDEDSVPEIPETPVTKVGDVWVLGNHRLMCGDSTSIDAVETLMDGHKADMVFTDPPYGVDYDGGSKKREKLKDDHIGTDIYRDSVPIMAAYCNGPCYTWYAGTKPNGLYTAVETLGQIHSLIIWKKNNSTFNMGINYKQKHEPCLYWKPKGATLRWSGPSTEDTVWEVKRESKNEYHPTQKPVALAERAINNHSVGLIFDLFGGSGSTLIACEKTNRNCRMMELDPKYCDVIVKRWQEYVGGEAILESTNEPFTEVA